ncbi:rifin [Plasmodium sp. gorilla clade G1]|nr:rifin [Plasmodium sp. gorilla clade G1]
MKLHYSKILLFSLPLNILVSSSYEHKKNKSYIIPHYTPTTTSRVLSECDMQTLIYDNDPEMRSVKENFDRQASQRFKEYDERMKDKRQKCKEQCDKDIQNIIVKDKVQKSLAQKVEKCCLRCGCGLGGGVLPVWGLVSGLWYATWSQYVAQAPTQKGIEVVISLLEQIPGLIKLPGFKLANIINANNYWSGSLFTAAIDEAVKPICEVPREPILAFCDLTSYNGSTIISQVSAGAESIATYGKQAAATEAANLAQKTPLLTYTITASFVAIVVIVLVMIIIYLILRYRRRKKMNKKQQYTKLLKE